MSKGDRFEYKVVVNTKEAKRSLEDFANTAGIKLKKVGKGAGGASGAFAKLTKSLAGSVAIGNIFANTFAKLAQLISEIPRYILDMTLMYQQLNATLKATTSGIQSFGEAQKYLREEAIRLGTGYRSMIKGYSQLTAAAKAAGVPLKDIQNIFTAINEASTVFQLSAADSYQAMRAIIQMFSKGTISAEELRGQLGERIPGALQIMAKSLGVTTRKLLDMMEKGELLASDVLPRFATALRQDISTELEETAHTLRREMQRAEDEFEKLAANIGESMAPVMSAIAKFLADAARDLNDIYEKQLAIRDLERAERAAVKAGVIKKEDQQAGLNELALLMGGMDPSGQGTDAVDQTKIRERIDELKRLTKEANKTQTDLLNDQRVKTKAAMADLVKYEKDKESLQREAVFLTNKYAKKRYETEQEFEKLILDDKKNNFGRLENELINVRDIKLRLINEEEQAEKDANAKRLKRIADSKAAELARIRAEQIKQAKNYLDAVEAAEMKAAEEKMRTEQEIADYEAKIQDEKAQRILDINNEMYENLERLEQDRMEKLKEKFKDFTDTIRNNFLDAFDAFVMGTKNAGDAFRDMITGMLRDLARLTAQKGYDMILDVGMKALMSAMGGAWGANATGVGGSISLQTGAPATIAAMTGGSGGMANGGIYPGGFQAFANGGMATKPTLGLVGEGRYNEAIVPLPDGKSIPVSMKGGGGVNINNNITIENGGSLQDPGQAQKTFNQLGMIIREQVRQVVSDERRVGGLFNTSINRRIV